MGGLGGSSGRPSLRHWTPCRPKGSPLWYFLRNPSKKSFVGERAPKKRNFLVKIFQKVPKNALLTVFFFKNLPAAQKMFPK